MKRELGIIVAAFLATPFVLVAQTPTPTPKPGLSAGTFAPGKSYSGVQMQQGRVQTDADWNEQLQTCRRQNDALAKQLKSRANELEIQLHQLEAAVDKADENNKQNAQNRDRKKAMRDSIRKMLDQIAEMHRATSF